jgi:hypothetical protein
MAQAYGQPVPSSRLARRDNGQMTEASPAEVFGALHPDYAALRRYLVDEELMDRAGGEYWRIGGPVRQ